MPVAKVLGIETEYGVAGGPDGDPITTSTLIVNAYAQHERRRVAWDFIDETPGRDARSQPTDIFPPAIEIHLANTVLTNGARLYVDHAHPEYSSPEVRTPLEAVLFDQAGELVMRHAMAACNATFDETSAIRLYKNNSDGKGNAYGTHENYLVDRTVPFDDLVRGLLPHFVSRMVYCGAGKVGAETDESLGYGVSFQLSARAEFFEEVVGLETTMRRPLINTRDEPHSDAEKYRRLHVINGDATMSPVATWLKLGTTSLLLSYIERHGVDALPPVPTRPVRAFRTFARDESLLATTATTEGEWRCLDYQEALFSLLHDFVEREGADDVAPLDEVRALMSEWRHALDALATAPDTLADSVDWIAKRRMIRAYQERYDCDPLDARLRAIDLQYSDLRPERSLASRARLRQLFTLDDIQAAVSSPPRSTRAFFRGTCVERFSDSLVSANWDSLVFDVGDGPLQRVSMMEPLRGTAALTESLLNSVSSAKELVVALNG